MQAQGQRRWRIGPQKDLSLVEGLPLKILANFKPNEEFVLNPGDMLYLPPHYAHDGVAIGDCQTYSIGFRSPSYQELGEAFLQFMADSIDLPGRYADPELEATAKPAEIPRHMLDTITEEINKVRFTEEDVESIRQIGDNTGCMTLKGASKRHETSERPDDWPMREDLLELAGRHGLGSEW